MTPHDTEELLEWISESTKRASQKALRHYTRGALVAFLLLLGSNIFVYATAQKFNAESRDSIVRSGSVVAVEGCNRDYETIASLRQVLRDASKFQKAALDAGTITEQEYEQAKAYYIRQVSLLKLPDCSKAKNVLNDDPDRPVQVPDPKG